MRASFRRSLGRVYEMWFAPLIIFWRLVYRLSQSTTTFTNCIFSPSFCLNNNKEFNLANVLFWGFQFFFPFYFLSPSSFHLLLASFSISPSAFISMGFFFLCCCCCHFVWTLSDDLRVERKRQALCIRKKRKTGNKARETSRVIYRREFLSFHFADFSYFSSCSAFRCVWSLEKEEKRKRERCLPTI